MPEVPTSSHYAPPTARVGDSELLAGYEGTGTFSIGQSVRDAWASVLRNLGPFLGVGAVLMLGGVLAVVILGVMIAVSPAFAVVTMGLLYIGFLPIFAWGFLRFSLEAIDGRARVGELFSIFERFGARFGKVALLWLVALILSVPGSLPSVLAGSTQDPWIVWPAQLWNIVWSMAVSTRFSLAFYFLVDRDMGVLEAVRSSWEWSRGNVLRFVGLFGASILIAIVGLLALGIGIIPASLVIAQLWPSAFRQIVGRPAPATAASVA